MKRFPLFIAVAVLCLVSFPLFASDAEVLQRTRVARVTSIQDNTTFSAEVPVAARLQGTAFFRTSIDINNNTMTTIGVQYQFTYTCLSSGCNPANGLYRTLVQTTSLPALGNFHADDIVDFLNGAGLLQPGAEQGALGTFLVTFTGVTPIRSDGTLQGSEAIVVARTYNHLDESTPSSATVGFAYNASLFFESTDTTLVGTARDTKASPGIAGKLRSNVGVHNTDVNFTQENVNLVLSCYDVASGQLVGNKLNISNLAPGEVRQIVDLWASAGIPSTVNQVIVFIDANPGGATFEGYVVILDGGAATGGTTDGLATQDASFFEMKCYALDCF